MVSSLLLKSLSSKKVCQRHFRLQALWSGEAETPYWNNRCRIEQKVLLLNTDQGREGSSQRSA